MDVDKVLAGLTTIKVFFENKAEAETRAADRKRLMLHWANVARDAAELIEAAPTVGGWISVKDRLPDGECIAYSAKWFEMIIGYVYKATASDTGYEAESEREVLRDVTHWMPLPEPPEGVSGDE